VQFDTGTLGALLLFMTSQTSVRNVLVCKRCSSRLVVACERPSDETSAIHTFSFACPACRGWNADVRLSGIAVERVFLDPRTRMRTESSSPRVA
jgi:Zn finger protein HypA/HybF involved in hydrogenase expression